MMRGSALVLHGRKVNLSYMYDGITVYPKSSGEVTGIAACIEKCRQRKLWAEDGIYTPRTAKRVKSLQQALTLQDKRIQPLGNMTEDYVYYYQTTHDFYHQDEFDREAVHYHQKFKFPLSSDHFIQMITIFAEEEVITQEEKDAYIAAFEKRHQKMRAALNAVCMPVEEKDDDPAFRKIQDERSLLKFIGSCRNNDLLVHLHAYLLEPNFDYLRMITDADNHPTPGKEWQGMNALGELVKTSRIWARLEKAISLQMIQNFRSQVRQLTSKLGQTRSKQFAQSHLFFGIKRSRFTENPDASRPNKTLAAFEEADKATLDRKYKKVFQI